MFKKLSTPCKRLLDRIEEKPATPFVHPAGASRPNTETKDSSTQNRIGQDRRASVHTPVPWDKLGQLSLPVDPSTVAIDPAIPPSTPTVDRNLVFPCPEPPVQRSPRHIQLPAPGSSLLYELGDPPTTPYPACAAELLVRAHASNPAPGRSGAHAVSDSGVLVRTSQSRNIDKAKGFSRPT